MLGRICFSSYIFDFLRVEGFLISHFSILLLVFFRTIYISSSSSLFDIIRFLFLVLASRLDKVEGIQSIAR